MQLKNLLLYGIQGVFNGGGGGGEDPDILHSPLGIQKFICYNSCFCWWIQSSSLNHVSEKNPLDYVPIHFRTLICKYENANYNFHLSELRFSFEESSYTISEEFNGSHPLYVVIENFNTSVRIPESPVSITLSVMVGPNTNATEGMYRIAVRHDVYVRYCCSYVY